MQNNNYLFLLSDLLFNVTCYSLTPLRPLSVSAYTYTQLLQLLSSAGLEPPTPGLQVEPLNRLTTDANGKAFS